MYSVYDRYHTGRKRHFVWGIDSVYRVGVKHYSGETNTTQREGTDTIKGGKRSLKKVKRHNREDTDNIQELAWTLGGGQTKKEKGETINRVGTNIIRGEQHYIE